MANVDRMAKRGTVPSGTRRSDGARDRLELEKTRSGIDGFDEITFGGLPKGRPTLLIGGPGSGKTLFAMQFLVRGALEYGEPGVFFAFEESVPDLKKNVRSLGYNLDKLTRDKLLVVEHAAVDEPSKVIGMGEYDLDALFMRLARVIDEIKAKRVVLDTLERIILDDRDRAVVRTACIRLFQWLKNRGVTSILTAERAQSGQTVHELEEFVSDCVVHLDHRVEKQISTRVMRVVKYRGSKHGSNEYPFLIDDDGIAVMPVTSVGLRHRVSDERVSSGIPRLDTMLSGRGFFRGSTVMISGTPGAGKSSLSAEFANAACARGEPVLYFTFEESPEQVIRNMGSIGLDLQRWVDQRLLRFVAARPSSYGLEMHLAVMINEISEFEPQNVIVDPITNVIRAGGETEAHGMAVRLVDVLKTRGITAVVTHPTGHVKRVEHTDVAISSIIDTWILVQSVESAGECNRTLAILKSRGMYHSNQIREFTITDNGIELADVYTGPEGILTGTARAAKEAQELANEAGRHSDMARAERRMDRRRKAIEAHIVALRAELEAEEADFSRMREEVNHATAARGRERDRMAQLRGADRS